MLENEFQLSIPARNVEAKFYNKKGIVYVEGDDDVIFWSQYFNPEYFIIRPLNGCRNLDYYEDEIIHHGLKCIVAKDSDYSSYKQGVQSHPLIVCTLSHSIECVMYCPYNINACLKKLARCLEDHLPDINTICDDYYNEIEELVVYDIANNVYGIGCSVCGSSCIPILETEHSTKVSLEKKNNLIQKIAPFFSRECLDKVRDLMNKDCRTLRQITRGHFQTSFILNLLKKLSSQITGDRSPSISNDALYALLITCYPGCSIDCQEKKVITERVAKAIAAL